MVGFLREGLDGFRACEHALLDEELGEGVELAAGEEPGIEGLAERLALPVATGIFDYASFPAHHPNYVGQAESVSEEEYDVVCCVATLLGCAHERRPRQDRLQRLRRRPRGDHEAA